MCKIFQGKICRTLRLLDVTLKVRLEGLSKGHNYLLEWGLMGINYKDYRFYIS